MALTITYYLDVISSWCHWSEPSWKLLKDRYQGRAAFQWKIALMDSSGLPKSRPQLEWFYRRSRTMMAADHSIQSGWYDPKLDDYLAPNLVAEAAIDFGVGRNDDRVRLSKCFLTPKASRLTTKTIRRCRTRDTSLVRRNKG
jgi:hypothetical protein